MPVKQRKQNIKKIPAVRKRTAIELFEELAKKYPRKPICRNDDFELSYDEMNSRANCVSFALLGRHAGLKGKVCALLAEKNPNYIAVIENRRGHFTS